jgi:DNA primase
VSDQFVDFRIVKQRVSIQAVLSHYGIQLRPANQHSLRGKCPLPTHSSQASRDSFSVELMRNIWACQSNSCAESRQGKRGGNVIDFVAVMENCTVRDAALKLNGWFPSANLNATSPRTGKGSGETQSLVAGKSIHQAHKATGNVPLAFTLRGVDSTHRYFAERGISESTARDFGSGFFPGRGTMNGRVVIPIANERGELVAYAGRAIDDTEPKYKLPAGFKKSEVLWNLHRVRRDDDHPATVIVVEGFFDAMKVVQAGFPNVVALMGSSLSESQRKLLDSFRNIVLMLDGDQAGEAATANILTTLAPLHFVRVVTVASQPDQLSSEEIQAVLANI